MTASAQLNAALSGRYEAERELGRGGMATVYLARDVRHGRRVALKVLKPEIGAVLGGERFLSEIRVTANLQHPNLLPLFDSGEADGLLYYVMPFVDGETLRTRLEREKQLAVDDAIAIARAVAAALDYAHRHGVVHRDLKPENILLHEGQPLVADFGIALAVSNAGGERITQTGLSLGTPQYMSPEQATGDRAIDGRADIYSLGAVLYEMLTGDPPHSGASAQAVIARVLTETPRRIRAERSAVPEYVEAAVDRALAKLPADRWTSAQDFADALSGRPDREPAWHSTRLARGRSGSRWLSLIMISAVSALVGAFVWAAVMSGTGGRGQATASGSGTARFALTFGPDQPVWSSPAMPSLAISRDGRLLAAVAFVKGVRTILLRTLEDPHARVVEGTEGADRLFFSPDGKWLGFVAGRRLMKVAVEGGIPMVVGEITNGAGAAWLSADQIVYSSENRLAVIPASGGTPRVFTELKSRQGEVEERWPLALSDGNTVLYGAFTGSLPGSHLGIATLADGRTELLPLAGTQPLGVIDGNLVYTDATGALMAVPFDVRRHRPTGTAVTLSDHLAVGPLGETNAALSLNGTLVYQIRSSMSQLVIAEPGAKQKPLIAEPRAYAYPRLSPDGKRVALTIIDNGRSDVWIFAIADGTLSRLTSEGSTNERAEWSPDGSTIIYRSDRDGGSSLWKRSADGSGPAFPLLALPGVQIWEGMLTPDGQAVVYRVGAVGGGDILYRRLVGDTTPHPIAATPFSEWTPRVSPNGRWVAYASDESGQYQVYVRPFPGPGARFQISTVGGQMPVWSRDGLRLYYQVDNGIFVADLRFTPDIGVTRRAKVLQADFASLRGGHAGYDVMPDGKGLLIPAASGEAETIVVTNWMDELRAAITKGASAATRSSVR